MKRIFTFVIVAVMLTTTLAGCGGNTSDTANNGEKYTYTMTMYQTGASNPDAIMKKDFEERFGVNIDVWDIEWQKYDEILTLKMVGGEVPDIIYVKTADAAQKYVDHDIVAPIDEKLLEDKAPNLLKRIKEDSESLLKYYYIDDQLYSLPSYSVGAGATGIPMVWRGDWLEKCGIDQVPVTLDEYEDAFYKFASNDPDGDGQKNTYGLSRSGLIGIFAAYGYIPSLGRSGADGGYWQARDGKLVYASIQPEMKDALTRISKWYKDGVLDPEFITGENKGGYWAISHQFVNGIIGFTCHGMSYHWEPQFYADADASSSGQDRYELMKLNPEASEKLEVSAIPAQLSDKPKTYSFGDPVKGERWMFSKELVANKDKFERLLEIYNEIYSDKATFEELGNGKKGETWDYEDVTGVDGKTYKRLVYLGDWADGEFRNSNKFNFAPFNPSFGKENMLETPRDTWANPRGFDKPYMPINELYVPLPSSAKYKAALTKLEEEAYMEIITGRQPIDYFDEFVAKWRNSGGSELEKEANAWYSAIK